MRALSTVGFVLAAFAAAAQPAPLIMDGDFEDWSGRTPIYEDPQDQPVGDIDFERLWIDNDDRYLYLSIVVGTSEILLQDTPSFRLLIDTDNDPSTGQPVGNIGADLEWSFGERSGTFWGSNGPVTVRHDHIGLIPAPTVTSTRFEIALDLDAEPLRQGPLFPTDTIAVAFEADNGGDQLPDAGDRIEFVIASELPERPYSYDLDRVRSDDLRVMAWNVLFDGLFDPNLSSHYSRIFAALDAEIIGFSEIYSHTAGETVDRMNELAPLDEGSWFGAGPGRDVVLVSRYPITRMIKFSSRSSATAFIVDLSEKGGSEILVVVAHFRCCDNDTQRQQQVDESMAFIRDAKTDGTLIEGTPIVILGDMNFVGDSRQLTTLLEGEIVNAIYRPSFDPDWDGTDFADASPDATGLPAAYTWPGRGEDFSPGRLDFVVFSDAVMELGRSFVLNTPTIPFDELQRLGLGAANTIRASDHLPVVTDFSGPMVTAVEEAAGLPGTSSLSIDVFPNPADSRFTVVLSPNPGEGVKLELIDVLGRAVAMSDTDQSASGSAAFTIDRGSLAPGLYFVRALDSTSLQLGIRPVIIR